jgi:hypothetical protein
MRRLPHNRLIQVGLLLVLLFGVAMVGELALRFGRFSGRAAGGVALQYLGPATNFVDPGWTWAAFSISNGTSKALFYYASGVDYRSRTGWVSAAWPRTPGRGPVGISSQSSSFVVAPSNSATFFASIPTSSIPWRLRVCYRQAGLRGSLWTSFYKLGAHVQGLPPSTVWSGRPQLLIGGEITP